MCGRYVRINSTRRFAELLGVPGTTQPELFDSPQYNLAPTQQALALAEDQHGVRHFGKLRWGFVPRWAEAASNPMINARAKNLAGKPFFADSFRLRRCLIPADGFYEWLKLPGRRKQPFAFRLQDGEPFAFAGLWDVWRGQAGFCILTTEANEVVQRVHERMPVIVEQRHYDLWLSRKVQMPQELAAVLCPYPAETMHCFPVGPMVNDARNDAPGCLLPAA
jgi:putative SOS response-associated peptidase YedK